MFAFRIIAGLALILILLTIARAQGDADIETPVAVRQTWLVTPTECMQIDSQVYGPDGLAKLNRFPGCAELLTKRPVDLNKETLIGWQIGGDCHMRVATKLTVNHRTKLYTFKMTNIYGGCRAGGWESGLFSVDKIPADYRVKFVRVLADRNGAERYPDRHETETWAGDGRKVEADGSISSPDAPKIVKPRLPEVPVQTREIDLDGCVRFRDGDRMIIKTQEELLARIRSDASREFCVNKVAGMKLDIGKNILYGISISSGYCFSPPGLKYSVTSDPNDKNYTFHVFYERAGINKCHVIRSFDLWVLAPKEPDGYFATFDVMEAKEGYVKP